MTSTPEVIQARRTESLDAPEILKLVSATTEKLFGRVNVVNIMWVNYEGKWSDAEACEHARNVFRCLQLTDV